MGLYDTVIVPCPKCGTKVGFQTKSGPCGMGTFDLETAPEDVLENVNRHAPATCEQCGTKFGANSNTRKAIVWDEQDPNEYSNPISSDFAQITTIRDLTDLLQDQTHLSYRLEQWVLDHKGSINRVFKEKSGRVEEVKKCMRNAMKELADLIAAGAEAETSTDHNNE